MANFKKYLFEKLFDMETGYVYSFNDVTFHAFIEESVGIDIDSNKYRSNGSSKAERLRTFWNNEDNAKVGKLLKDMIEYFETTYTKVLSFEKFTTLQNCKKEIDILLSDAELYTDKLNFGNVKEDLTLKELKTSIETELNNRKYNVALDRLHTYCMKYFRTKAEELSLTTDKDKPLHSVAGEVFKKINVHQSEMTMKILRSSLSVLDNFNKVRNEQSLAHDNEILDNSEAKLIADWTISLLGYVEECFTVYNKKENELNADDIPF